MPAAARIARTLRQRLRRRLSIAAALACLAASGASADESPAVATIEAAYLTKFPAFVNWPPGAPSALCVLASESVTRLIDQAESKLPADADAAVVRRLRTDSPATECRILFIGDPNQGPADRSQATSVLVVTDQAAEGRKGVINFVIRDDRVRFEIDDAEAARRGLVISSKLLSLAVAVKPRA